MVTKENRGTLSWKKISRFCGEYSFILVFILIFLVYVLTCNGLTWAGMMNIFRHSAIIGIIAIGMGLICLTGEIDLSVGSMPAFIVSLATMLIFRSFAQYFCQKIDKNLLGGGSSVYRMSREMHSYDAMFGFGNGKILTLPIVGIVLILLTLFFVYISTSTKYGKKVYAVGSNAKAAEMSGINVSAMKISVFTITGILVGIGAFLWISMNASADPATTGNSYEMYAIAAVILGGISMSGGKGKCIGIFFGALSYTIIDKIIVALKMDSLINDAIKGIILILVIMIQIVGPQLKAKFLVKK